ncbi:MAG: TonB-dependent receptor [Pseudomonadota bacterium]
MPRNIAAQTMRMLLIASILGATSAPLYAQSVPASDEDIDEIIVQGQKRAPLRVTDSNAATLLDVDISELPLSISVISRGLIDAVNSTTTRQLIEQNASVVTRSGHARTFQGVSIRGFAADAEANSALKNGIPFYGVDSAVADPSALERIEVLKGAVGLLFGAAEPGGVINYVYRAPQFDPYFGVRATVGQFNTQRLDFDATGAVLGSDKVAARFTLGWEDSEGWQDFDYTEKLAPTLQVRANLTDRTTLSLLAEMIRFDSNPSPLDTFVENGEIVELPIETFLGHDNDFSEEETNQVQLTLKHDFNEEWGILAQYGYNTTKRDAGNTGYWTFFGTPAPDGTLNRLVFDQRRESRGQYFGAHVTWDKQIGDWTHKALIGVNVSSNDMNNNNGFNILLPPEFFVPAAPTNIFNPVRGDYPHRTDFDSSPPFAILDWTYTDEGLNLQDLITYEPWNLNILIGLRNSRADVTVNSNTNWTGADQTSFQSLEADEWIPRVGLVWDATDQLSLFTSYGESFRPPFGLLAQDADGNPITVPTRGRQYEAGIRWNWESGGVTLTGFELSKFNVVVPTEVPNVSVVDGEQKSQGIELEASGTIANDFDLYLSYAYTDTEVVDSGFGAAANGLPFAGIPEHKVVFWGFWSFLDRWSVGYGLDYQPDSPGDQLGSFSVPERMLHQLRLRSDWEIGDARLDLDLEVRNLTDERWFQTTSSIVFIKNGEPRGVYLSGTLSFQ